MKNFEAPAVLLINLGSPKDLSKKSVRNYLKVFLSDDYVLDIPKFFQQLLLRLFILPFRPKSTLHAYEQIWTKQGSPLIISTVKLAQKLETKTGWKVSTAMRYEEPSIKNALIELKNDGYNNIYAVPLYPHNAMATVLTTQVEVLESAKKYHRNANIKFVEPFYNDSNYISAMANSIRSYMVNKDFEKIIFSYHGIPKRQARKTDETGMHCFSSSDCCEQNNIGSRDCYKSHTVKASTKIAESLGLHEDNWEIAYQSRIGPGWLQPFTDKRLAELPEEGKKSIAVVCPSFISDCLETLEEIDIRGRKTFFDAGGEHMTYIPCLNESDETIELIENLVKKILK